ncbi:C-OmpA-like family protein CmpA [Legionella sp. CNM-4043-24]|uniref:C-OmpA-like family protein CmpA n=1 Tax=Legionella sp. CNM-4043-24 TaxID=3421646 RepID=UPI00403B2478
MTSRRFAKHLAGVSLLSLILSGCFHPPFNNFKPYNRAPKDAVIGAGVGTVIGAAAGTPLIGTGVGAVAFTARGLYKDSRANVLRELKRATIQYVNYGDTHTLIVPTDRFYVFNSSRLNEACYPGLVLIAKLLRFYPNSTIYVAGFTDNIGTRYHKNKLSQARAETMLTFLWANGIQAQRLSAEGYGDKHDVSDNSIVHGSAQNRRIEIQWFNNPAPQASRAMPYSGATK